MGRAIERIERDIAVLQEAIQAIAAELHSAYASYLTILGQVLRKQLILASYHLCTQGYPHHFLSLSLKQRQQLQQAIRKLGQKAAEQLLTCIKSESENEENEVENENNPQSQILGLRVAGIPNPGTEGSRSLKVADHSNPMELAKWQQSLEEEIQQALKKVSHDANILLQKAGVLPQKLPEPILEAAAAVSEASAEVMPGPPNLLNLVIEIENEQDAEESSLTQVITINLSLGEIEFADTILSSSRRQIRNILVQLNKLGREYQKKQRERSIADAEAAWRSSWFED